MKRFISIIVPLLLMAMKVPAAQPATTSASLPTPSLALSVGEEEHKKIIRALVTLNGKPVENAAVSVFARRTFGKLPLGKDTTLDDGTAAVAFPTGLPGDAAGQLQVVAEVAGTPQYAAVTAQSTLSGGTIVAEAQDPFPRALWAPHAPIALIVPIVILLGGVWTTYIYVISQIIAIRRGAQS